ncbi:ROK family protein [Lentibacillus saliphilus]|uniref:ROK family protein n=1 Tax=Lentibacillus saliphilus TaxID=2737028 RepID=UPI001C2FB01F|nr:ROK family protein [Lentibacillus saliphilus]
MHMLAIDIGGTNIQFGLFQDGELLFLKTIATPKEAILEAMIAASETFLSDYQADIAGIGIASAGIIDAENGVIKKASNIPSLVGVPVKAEMERVFNVPVFLNNDANCAALAEGVYGAAQGMSSYVCMTIGTGIGGGVVLNEKVVNGRSGFAGEVGHMTLFPGGLQCPCGKKGCWEQYASGSAIKRMIAEHPDGAIADYSPQQVFECASDNAACQAIVDQFIDHLAIGVTNLQYTFDPEAIVIGGGVIDSSAYWWDKFVTVLDEHAPIEVIVKQAQLKNHAGLFGASLLIKNEGV